MRPQITDNGGFLGLCLAVATCLPPLLMAGCGDGCGYCWLDKSHACRPCRSNYCFGCDTWRCSPKCTSSCLKDCDACWIGVGSCCFKERGRTGSKVAAAPRCGCLALCGRAHAKERGLGLAGPPSALVYAGDTGTVFVEVNREGFRDPVEVSISNLPAGVTSPNATQNVRGHCVSFVIQVRRDAPAAIDHQVNITGMGPNGIRAMTPVKLTVQ